MRGMWVGLLVVARAAYAGETDDRVTLMRSDVDWITGTDQIRYGLPRLQKLCAALDSELATHGPVVGTAPGARGRRARAAPVQSRYTVHVRNLKRKQAPYSTKPRSKSKSTIQEEEEESSATPSRRTTPSPDAIEFARKFRSSLKARTPDAKLPKELERWQVQADRMLRVDKRDLREAIELATWLFNDTGDDAAFWRGTVRGVPKFRTQYERLREHRARGTRKEKRGGESELKKAIRGVARRRGLVRDGDGEEDRTVRGHARRLPSGEEPGS